MRFLSLRMLGSIGLAFAASGLIVGALVTASIVLSIHSQTSAHYLPAAQTVAVFQRITPEDLPIFLPWFPALSDVPLQPGTQTVALISLPDNRTGWALFRRTEEGTLPQNTRPMNLGPFAVAAPSAEVQALLHQEENKLSDADVYRGLMRSLPEGRMQLFADTKILPPLSPTPTLLDGIRKQLTDRSRFIAVSLDETSTHIAFIGALPGSRLSLSSLKATPDTLLTIGGEDLATLWNTILSGSTRDDRLIFQSLSALLTQTFLGKTANLEADFLPLLTKTSVIHFLPASGSGKTAIAIEGEAPEDVTKKDLARLHESIRRSLLEPQRVVRQLDDQFTFTTMQMDEESIEQETEEVGQWEVRSTKRVETGLFTATDGERFLITTDSSFMKKFLQGSLPSLPLPRSGGGNLRLGGFLRPADLSLLLDEVKLHTLKESSPSLWLQSQGRMGFSMEQVGAVTVLSIEANE